LKLIYLQTINSTQIYLKDLIKKVPKEYFIYTLNQTNGVGSRGNSWLGVEGNLFFSFSICKDNLPKDLKIESSSIYFSYLLKEVLSELGSDVFIKWPNDFYIKDKKIGGTITNMVNNFLICGSGLNLNKVNDEFGFLDIDIDIKYLIKKYIKKIKLQKSWKDVFTKYKKDFEKSKKFLTTINNEKISLNKAILKNDGSIFIGDKRFFSLR